MQEHEPTPAPTGDLAGDLAGDLVGEPTTTPPAIEFTGQAAVDAVLQSLAALDDLPVAEHVEVFDRAHDGLRRALDDAGREPAPGQD